MPDIMKSFIEPLMAVMTVKASDPGVLIDDLQSSLTNYSDKTLAAAAQKIRTRKPREGFYRDAATFPSVAECIEWCSMEMPKVTQAASEGVWERKAYNADRLINSNLGRRAADEGWIMGLWDHYHEFGQEPSENKVHELRRKALPNDELEADCHDMTKTQAWRVASQSMRAKRAEKIGLAMQGEEVG